MAAFAPKSMEVTLISCPDANLTYTGKVVRFKVAFPPDTGTDVWFSKLSTTVSVLPLVTFNVKGMTPSVPRLRSSTTFVPFALYFCP